MGTRGITGFVIDEVEKIGYQQYDSYPDGVGLNVLNFLRTADLDVVRQQARYLQVVNQDEPPTEEQIIRLAPYANTAVSTGSPTEWYVLLRETQGDPAAILNAGFVEDHSLFPADSLFCEWGYIIDLDNDVLEVYKGFQTEDHADGRFHDLDTKDEKYRPIRLVASWPLDALPEAEEFCAIDRDNEEDEA